MSADRSGRAGHPGIAGHQDQARAVLGQGGAAGRGPRVAGQTPSSGCSD